MTAEPTAPPPPHARPPARLQAAAGWYGYMVAMNDYGYAPWILPGLGHKWDDHPLLCRIGSDGRVRVCVWGGVHLWVWVWVCVRPAPTCAPNSPQLGLCCKT